MKTAAGAVTVRISRQSLRPGAGGGTTGAEVRRLGGDSPSCATVVASRRPSCSGGGDAVSCRPRPC